MATETFDVIIVGAGLSGIDAGYRLQSGSPGKSYVILEGRDAIGGTWDLFRYPGIRSDSDMFTFGYPFRPWETSAAIADGPSIRAYIRDTAATYGIDRHIRFQHRVTRASWSSADRCWTVDVERGAKREPVRLRGRFLFCCAGYYDYGSGYTPELPGVERFNGRLIHPQQWPDDLDYAGRRIVVVGSGATAVTIVPVLAETAAHVIMLQRSPTYIISMPARDRVVRFLRRILPSRAAHTMARWYYVLFGIYFYGLSRRKPEAVKRWIVGQARAQLGADYDVERHFTPHYNPWDQRLCVAPDGDFFRAVKSGKAEVVTDRIDTFTATGVRLQSGRGLEADIVITATGLRLQLLGGIRFEVDGVAKDIADTMIYRGTMFSDVPNFFFALGYTNASWTLKCDLTSLFAVRLINHMDGRGYDICTPRRRDPAVTPEPLIDLTSGYIQRAIDQIPHQGSKPPWKLHQNYALDLLSLRFGAVDDPNLEFTRLARAQAA